MPDEERPNPTASFFADDWDESAISYGAFDLFDLRDKMDEAAYFLGCMEEAHTAEEFRWLASACLSAMRACLDYFAWAALRADYDDEGEPRPSESALMALNPYLAVIQDVTRPGRNWFRTKPKDQLLVLMDRLRQQALHRSPLQIAQPDGPGESHDGPRNESFTFPDLPTNAAGRSVGNKALLLCRAWLALIHEVRYELGP